jgi:hypothetical protein
VQVSHICVVAIVAGRINTSVNTELIHCLEIKSSYLFLFRGDNNNTFDDW